MSCANISCTMWEKWKIWITKRKEDDDGDGNAGEIRKSKQEKAGNKISLKE